MISEAVAILSRPSLAHASLLLAGICFLIVPSDWMLTNEIMPLQELRGSRLAVSILVVVLGFMFALHGTALVSTCMRQWLRGRQERKRIEEQVRALSSEQLAFLYPFVSSNDARDVVLLPHELEPVWRMRDAGLIKDLKYGHKNLRVTIEGSPRHGSVVSHRRFRLEPYVRSLLESDPPDAPSHRVHSPNIVKSRTNREAELAESPLLRPPPCL